MSDASPTPTLVLYAAVADLAFLSALRVCCLMKRSVFSCASLSTICTGGDFIR